MLMLTVQLPYSAYNNTGDGYVSCSPYTYSVATLLRSAQEKGPNEVDLGGSYPNVPMLMDGPKTKCAVSTAAPVTYTAPLRHT